MIDQILEFNKTFVAQKGYEKYVTDKYPDKKLAVLSCMDTRLTELLPAALGIEWRCQGCQERGRLGHLGFRLRHAEPDCGHL